MPAVERPRLLTFGHERAVAGGREKAANSGAARPNPLGKRPLRDELDVDLACQELSLELPVLADVGRDHLADLASLEQHADAEIVDPGVIADDREIPGPACAQGCDQVLGNAAEPESTHHDAGPVGDEGDGVRGARHDLVHSSKLPGKHSIK